MSLYTNGGLIGVSNTTTSVAAGGVWTRNDQLIKLKDSLWPVVQMGYGYSDVKLLSGFEGSSTDDTGRHSMSDAGTYLFSTTQKKFGSYSKYFNGAGAWSEITGNTSDFQFGTGDFTIEAWIRHPSVNTWSGNKVFFSINRENNGVNGGPNVFSLSARTETGFKLAAYFNDALGFATGSTELAHDTWHHIALCRSGGTIYLCHNGSVQNMGTSTKNITYITSGIWIKRDYWSGEDDYKIYIDELRVVKGWALYTDSYTVPTEAFPRS